MRDYTVTFSAIWTDRHGVTWTTGKQKRTVKAENRAAAVLQVRGSWPEGAGGECKAEPESHALLERSRFNVAHGKPPSTWDENFPADLMDAEVVYYPI
jgi:hypothetical protein